MFDWLLDLFKPSPLTNFDADKRRMIMGMVEELVEIGKKEDYLSEHPGGAYNGQCKHRRTREIGERLYSAGGMPVLWWAYDRVRRKLGSVMASHLEYAWAEIGEWLP